MKSGPVIGLVIVSLLLWAAASPSATTFGETRLDDIIRALLGIKPKQVDPNSVVHSGGISGGVGTFKVPANPNGPVTLPPLIKSDPMQKPGSLMGLF